MLGWLMGRALRLGPGTGRRVGCPRWQGPDRGQSVAPGGCRAIVFCSTQAPVAAPCHIDGLGFLRPGQPAPRPACCDVYRWCMTRTNIDIDDELVTEAMRRYGMKTKKQAVDLALRRLVASRLTREFLLSLQGTGWDGDLAAMRRSEPVEEL